MNKIKIAILGCAATKHCFIFPNKIENDQIYEIVATQYESSLISIMSSPVELNFESKAADKNTLEIIKRDREKVFLQELVQNQPDYIIIDTLIDILYGTYKINESIITNNIPKLKKISIKDDYFEFSINSSPEEYTNLLLESLDKFIAFCEENLSNTKLIFNFSLFADSYYDDQRVIRPFNRYDIINKNVVLKSIYSYLKNNKNIYYIDLTGKTYFSTVRHKWSSVPTPIHFEIGYNKDFMFKLDRIIIKSFIQ